MSDRTAEIIRLMQDCSSEEKAELAAYLNKHSLRHPLENDWGVDSQTILSAIRRSSDLTKRGMRGIIAEAIFERDVLPRVSEAGWRPLEIAQPDPSYDSSLEKNGVRARIQIKLQRMEAGKPKRFRAKHYQGPDLFVVEVQRTRTGTRRRKKSEQVDAVVEAASEQTRPYRFDDFDILAVNMQPSTGDWTCFRYTIAKWLLPRPSNHKLIEIFQPVSLDPTNTWAEDLSTCLRWFEEGEHRTVLDVTRNPQ